MLRAPRIPLLLALALAPVAADARPDGPVVLDPGHGGAKDGARSAAGALEKDVALAVSRKTAAILAARGLRVVTTRDADVDLDLPARAAVAVREDASVYVSIHANWAPVPERRGVETYVLSPEASDADAAAALHLEEGAEPAPAAEQGGDLSMILADLEKGAAHRESARLAKAVQDELGAVKGLGPSRGLRQAPFRVLKEARSASVLVELGYLSNPAQGALLATAAGQDAAAAALARGILRFLGRR